ncbi:MAG: hypothetical protein U0360_01605 [Dehalococcoidia bacterium]
MTTPGRPSQRSQLLGGTAALATALLVVYEVNTSPEGANAPTWVGNAAAGAFGLAGVSLLASALRSPRGAWMAAIGAAASLLLMALWVSLGAGARNCSLSLAFVRGGPGDLLCRGVFALGSVLVALLVVLMLRRGPPNFPRD